jgi:hypothetical protein
MSLGGAFLFRNLPGGNDVELNPESGNTSIGYAGNETNVLGDLNVDGYTTLDTLVVDASTTVFDAVNFGRVFYVRESFSNTDATVSPEVQYIAQTGAMSPGNRILTIPLASGYGAGRAPLCIADESGTVATDRRIILTRQGSDLINGATTAQISTNYGAACIVSNGVSKWTVISLR